MIEKARAIVVAIFAFMKALPVTAEINFSDEAIRNCFPQMEHLRFITHELPRTSENENTLADEVEQEEQDYFMMPDRFLANRGIELCAESVSSLRIFNCAGAEQMRDPLWPYVDLPYIWRLDDLKPAQYANDFIISSRYKF